MLSPFWYAPPTNTIHTSHFALLRAPSHHATPSIPPAPRAPPANWPANERQHHQGEGGSQGKQNRR